MPQDTHNELIEKTDQPTTESNVEFTSLEEMQQDVNELKALFVKRLSYDAAKDKAFDTLYDKMKQFDGDFQASLKKGMLRSLLLLHDNMTLTEERLSEMPEAQEQVAYLRQELLDILYVEDIEPIDASGETYDRQLQEAVSVIITDDAAKDGTVAKTSKIGFMLAKNVFRPHKVIIYRYSSDTNGDK